MNQVQIYLPPPTDWQAFQLLVKQIAEIRYDPATVVEYGRQGQRQHGVDVYAEDNFGKKIGIQCKESKGALTIAVIEKEADKAKGFSQALDTFVVATTARTDATVQDKVMSLNASGVYSFKIRVDFWDVLIGDINRYAIVLNGCYQAYRETFQKTDESHHLACLRVAFDRPAFTDDFLYERNYDDFEEALISSKRLFRTGFTMDRWSQIPIVQTVPLEFLPDGQYRKLVSKIEGHLEKIYKAYTADKKQIVADQRYAQDRAGHYNILRRELLTELNNRLVASGLQEIQFAYQ